MLAGFSFHLEFGKVECGEADYLFEWMSQKRINTY